MDYYCQTANYFYYPSSLSYFYMGNNAIDQSYAYSNVSSGTDNYREISPIEQNSSPNNQNNEQPSSLQNDSAQTREKKEKQKKVISLKDSQPRNLQDQDFEIKFESYKKGVLYKKKNTESNIINQVISFINGDRSLPILEKVLGSNQQKIKQYYKLINSIKKANKKYTNRKYLKKLLTFAEKSQFQRVFLKSKITLWTISEVRQILNKLVLMFIRDESRLSILTSAKIYKETLSEHFWRKRQIEQYLFLQNHK